jgi:hypothetical protein
LRPLPRYAVRAHGLSHREGRALQCGRRLHVRARDQQGARCALTLHDTLNHSLHRAAHLSRPHADTLVHTASEIRHAQCRCATHRHLCSTGCTHSAPARCDVYGCVFRGWVCLTGRMGCVLPVTHAIHIQCVSYREGVVLNRTHEQGRSGGDSGTSPPPPPPPPRADELT